MKFASAFAILMATTASSLTTMVSGENVHGEERQLAASGNGGSSQGNGKGEPRNSVILFEAELEEGQSEIASLNDMLEAKAQEQAVGYEKWTVPNPTEYISEEDSH